MGVHIADGYGGKTDLLIWLVEHVVLGRGGTRDVRVETLQATLETAGEGYFTV